MALASRLALRKFVSQRAPDATRSNVMQTAHYYLKPQQKKRTSWSKLGLKIGGALITTGAAGGFALGYNWDGLEDEFVDLPLQEEYTARAKSKISDWLAYMMEPRAQELLLPDLLPPPYQAPYTLLIELNDLLIHSSYTRTAGWRRKKRQGLDIFLESLCKHYEIVIFTQDLGMNCVEVIEAIDPKMCVLYKLFRDSTRYKKGVYLKDLSNLNRDLSKVILVDTNRDAVACQPENALVLNKWMGEDDMDLIDLADMLVVIAQDRPADLREVIKCYTELDDPIHAFRMRRQEILDEENRRKLEAMQKAKNPGGILGKKWWR
jgi:import inner membrane translocase subunit TIM50